MSAEAATVLREASKIIEDRGHTKGDFTDDEGRLCLWGAIYTVTGAELVPNPHIRPTAPKPDLFIHVPRHVPRYQDGVVPRPLIEIAQFFRAERPSGAAKWNDEPDTTAEDVAKFLLSAADKIEVQ